MTFSSVKALSHKISVAFKTRIFVIFSSAQEQALEVTKRLVWF